jgi:ribosomal protein S18 acetylase RimI-like enzyme
MIHYSTILDGVTADHLRGGFFVGWPNPPSAEAHLRLLRGSAKVVLARQGEDGDVVGFITAISDGVMAAYIPLLEVLPAYQERGIGAELVRRMLDQLQDFYMVDLLCGPELQPYYEQFGMRRAVGMMVRNYDRQSGQ